MPGQVQVWYNPRCSTCRGAEELLADRGVDPQLIRYLDEAPPRAEIERVLGLLGLDDPRQMMRTKETDYAEHGLATATRDELLDAMASHPVLIQRPIVIHADRAVIARPPERLLELLD